jgi:hypothetical protein
MKVVLAPAFLAALAVVLLLPGARAATAPTCRPCEKITEWKMYRSGFVDDWPVRIPEYTIDTPGYFTRIKNGTCVPNNRVDDDKWNVMMTTDSTFKKRQCCGDTDGNPNDYVDLCARIVLYKMNGQNLYEEIFSSWTELFWPWFLFGDVPCDPTNYWEGEATFNHSLGHCNPSKRIYDAKFSLSKGYYKLVGSTYHGCPERDSGQGGYPTGDPAATSMVLFAVC